MDIKQIPKSTSKNFDTLVSAIKNGDVCIMRARETENPDNYVTLICAAVKDKDDMISMVPFAVMTGEDGNPFEKYIPAPDERFEMTTDEIDKLIDEQNAIDGTIK